MTRTIVLVHGAWHRANCWDALQKELRARGVTSHAVNLPSSITGPIDGDLPGTDADAEAVRAVLDQVTGPVLLVGHSYGGVVISAIGKHRSIGGLVYLAAFCLATGESAFELAVGDPPPLTAQALTVLDDGTCTIKPELAAETFYGDLPADEANKRARSLVPTTLSVFTNPTEGSPLWQHLPATYIVCEADRAISPDRQEFMANRATNDIVRLETSHSPFVSRPAAVADILVSRLAKLTQSTVKP